MGVQTASTGLDRVQKRLNRFVAGVWPEAIYPLCRAALDETPAVDAAWIEQAAEKRYRLCRERGPATGADRTDRLHPRAVVRVAVVGRWVYSVGADGDLVAYRPDSGAFEAPETASLGRVTALGVRPGGGVVCGCDTGRVFGWVPGLEKAPVEWYRSAAAVVSVAPTDDGVLIGHADGLVFRVETASSRPKFVTALRGPARGISSLGANRFAFLTLNGGYGIRDGDRVTAGTGGGAPVVLLLAAEGRLLCGHADGAVVVHDLAGGSGSRTHAPPRSVGPVVGLAVGRDGAFASDPTGRVWPVPITFRGRAATGRLAWDFAGEELVVGAPNGGIARVPPPTAPTVPPRTTRRSLGCSRWRTVPSRWCAATAPCG